jgi:hypothetical protein
VVRAPSPCQRQRVELPVPLGQDLERPDAVLVNPQVPAATSDGVSGMASSAWRDEMASANPAAVGIRHVRNSEMNFIRESTDLANLSILELTDVLAGLSSPMAHCGLGTVEATL